VLLAPAPPAMTDSAPVALSDDPVPAGSSPRFDLPRLDEVRVAMGPAESPPPARVVRDVGHDDGGQGVESRKPASPTASFLRPPRACALPSTGEWEWRDVRGSDVSRGPS
jgi:hypothetical protein